MSNADQLQWEARLGRPAAAAAFAAGLLVLAGQVVFQMIFEERPKLEVLPEFLLSVDENPGTLIASRVIQAVAALCLIAVFYYLFRAIRHRNPDLPAWFVYLVVIGPAFYAIAQVLGALNQIDIAQQFAEGSYSFPDAEAPDQGDPDLRDCPAIRGELGGACADEVSEDGQDAPTAVFGLLGSVLLAFLFVMLPLRARRVGLMSPFMGILGVIAGVLLVLPLLPGVPVIIQAFWLGALGLLFVGNWPGGRGPAWETGEAVPWPSPAQRRGQVEAGDEAEGGSGPDRGGDGNGAGPTEPEAVPERPSSRKRKRKR